MKRITLSLTEDQVNDIIRGLGYTMRDYSDLYPDYKTKEDKQVEKHNAFVQRLIDNIIKQTRKQIS